MLLDYNFCYTKNAHIRFIYLILLDVSSRIFTTQILIIKLLCKMKINNSQIKTTLYTQKTATN